MIRYRLNCDQNHEFEAWFRNSDAYDEQRAEDQVACPRCGSVEITKTLMTPGIPAKGRSTSTEQTGTITEAEAMAALARKLRSHVEENADYVGDRFAEEARKIHYEETEPRGIYGEATPEEATDLRDEGVEVHPLPPTPEDKN